MAEEKPTTCFHYTEFILDELEARGWSIQELAIRMNWQAIGIDILALEIAIAVPECLLDEKFAEKLALVFGTSKELWLNLDTSYRKSKEGKCESPK